MNSSRFDRGLHVGHWHGRGYRDVAGKRKLHRGRWHHLAQLYAQPSPLRDLLFGHSWPESGRQRTGQYCFLVCLSSERRDGFDDVLGVPRAAWEQYTCCWPGTRVAVWLTRTRQPGGMAAHPGICHSSPGANFSRAEVHRGYFGYFPGQGNMIIPASSSWLV